MTKVFSSKDNQFTNYLTTVLHDVGILLHIPGIMALLSLPVCFIFREFYAVFPFLLTTIASLGTGQLLYRLCCHAEQARLRHALITVALSWGLIPFFAAIPIELVAIHLVDTWEAAPLTIQLFQDPWNAVFETFSGFTSTGLSMALRPSELPQSLLWWRSFMEWVGGVGVIVLMISLLEPSTDAYQLYSAEGRQKLIGLTLKSTVRRIWWIYLFYTGLSILWFRVAGMPWWDAINHGMAGISTGGFTITDDSISAYSPLVQLAVIPVMILGAISFSVHAQFFAQRRVSAFWADTQHRALWLLLGLGMVALLLEHYWFRGRWLWVDSVFQWVSALGTCGFSTANVANWSTTSKLMLGTAMICGGAAGSTVGGLKMSRVAALMKAIIWRFQRVSLQPHQIMRYRLDGKLLTDTEANRRIESAAVLAILWLGLIGLGITVLLHAVPPAYNLEDVFFETASALGSVGLSIGITHPDLSWMGKLVLIVFMWMGRLEIVPVLLLLTYPLGLLSRMLCRRAHRKG